MTGCQYRWYLEPDICYLRVTVDRFTGTVVEGSLLTQYYLSPKVGIEGGLGIKGVEVDIDPKTDGGFGPKIGARIKYTESQFRVGVVVPL